MLLRKRKVTTEQSDNRRICFLCNSIFINPLSKGAKRKSFQLAEVNIPKHVFKMTTQTGAQLKAEEAGRQLWQFLGMGSRVPLDPPAPLTAQTHPQPPQHQQETQDVRAAGGIRIVLAVLSPFDGMTGFNTSLCLQQTHECPHRHRGVGFFFSR